MDVIEHNIKAALLELGDYMTSGTVRGNSADGFLL